MPKQSAGIVMYRYCNNIIQVLLVHPGGPFWSKKDAGAWSIPKGEFASNEDPLIAAQREFEEETGFSVTGNFVALAPIKQAGGKIVHAWAVEGDCDASQVWSNTFQMEWPPHSGKQQEFPEVDRAEWFDLPTAHTKILKSQMDILDELQRLTYQG
jgi:predicted NUDIX family NTP pyrophosphohydrolase